MAWAYTVYGLLAASVAVLAHAAHLTSGFWMSVVALMLAADGGWKWKWAMALMNAGVMGMTVALLVAGYEQSFIERAIGGSSWNAFFQAQAHPWFQQSMWWRQIFGCVTPAGYGLMVWDLLTIGKRESRSAPVHAEVVPAAA